MCVQSSSPAERYRKRKMRAERRNRQIYNSSWGLPHLPFATDRTTRQEGDKDAQELTPAPSNKMYRTCHPATADRTVHGTLVKADHVLGHKKQISNNLKELKSYRVWSPTVTESNWTSLAERPPENLQTVGC